SREELGEYMEKLTRDVIKFEEQRERILAREAAREAARVG
ncbi:acyl-ACP desaturase, partial [Nocardia cyriacigeorgica]|nr:acyl-ACP desaturase [Nocardia cyriacigeorgica]